MSRKKSKRIIPEVNPNLDNPIEKKADESYLQVVTYARQLIQQVVKNNLINKY